MEYSFFIGVNNRVEPVEDTKSVADLGIVKYIFSSIFIRKRMLKVIPAIKVYPVTDGCAIMGDVGAQISFRSKTLSDAVYTIKEAMDKYNQEKLIITTNGEFDYELLGKGNILKEILKEEDHKKLEFEVIFNHDSNYMNILAKAIQDSYRDLEKNAVIPIGILTRKNKNTVIFSGKEIFTNEEEVNNFKSSILQLIDSVSKKLRNTEFEINFNE